jgi:hypothetical protein
MAVTLKVFPPYFTVLGIVTLVSLLVIPMNFTVVELVTSYLCLLAVKEAPFFALMVKVFVMVPV